ncbi:TetR/AcrR family transcriptional regulator [Pantoea sp. BS_8]|uniref:TetR/AcrR family transcriptional regulator n=1 Tax=Pantoea sp. BS_8 TaxID=3055781 RepID=UPI0035BF1ABF
MNRSEEILDAAEYCMRQKGFYQTSIQSIASQANVSIGLIYKYYKNKEAIVEALVTKVVQRMIVLLKADFEKMAESGKLTHSPGDTASPEVEKSIVLLIEISSESTRNARVRQILHHAWQVLKDNFIVQQQALNPALQANIIHTRLYVISLAIDGMIIRRFMKQRDIDTSFMSFFETINHDVNHPNAG